MKAFPIYFLDADQTLFDFKRAEAESIVRCFASFGLPCGERETALYHRVNDRLWKALERGEVTQQQLRVQRFVDCFAQLGLKEDPVEAAKRYANALAECAYLLPETETVCRELSKRADLYLTTNGIAAIQRGRFARSGLGPYFKDLFVSEELGVSKPHPDYFTRILTRIGADKGDVLVVGDSLTSDIKGANAAGIACCWYQPNEQLSAEGVHFDWRISRLSALLETDCINGCKGDKK